MQARSYNRRSRGTLKVASYPTPLYGKYSDFGEDSAAHDRRESLHGRLYRSCLSLARLRLAHRELREPECRAIRWRHRGRRSQGGPDFVIADGFAGPGRFLGWAGGVRVLDAARWWGEGEVKVYLDGERQPTICGTGTEDYLDSAWGLGTFAAPESGAPLVWSAAGPAESLQHDWAAFYRWHLADPIVFAQSLRVTVQQMGMAMFREGQESEKF